MNEEIIKVLDELAQRFGIIIDWTSENVMPYLTDLYNRIISFKIATTSMWLGLGVLALIFCIVYLIICVKSYHKAKTGIVPENLLWKRYGYGIGTTELNDYLGICAAILAFAGVPCVIGCTITLFRAIYIPEVVVLNMISGYM